MKIQFVVFSLIFSGACPSFSKELTQYEAYIQAKTREVGGVSGAVVDLLATARGWSCRAGASMKLTELVPGSSGKLVPKVFATSSDYSFDTVWMGQPSIRSQFYVNFENLNPEMSIEVNEHCSREVEDTCRDERGKKYSCSKTETLDFYWDCALHKEAFPTEENETAGRICQPRNNSLQSMSNALSAPGSLFNFFNEKDIIVTLRNGGVRKSLKDYNCGGNFKNAKTLRFSQGVAAGVGEDDFYFYLKINNGPIFTRRSNDGIITFDLAYCPQRGEQDLTIHMSAMEQDLVFDDHYAQSAPGKISLRGGGSKSAHIQLNRKKMIGSDISGDVAVHLIKGKGKRNSGPQEQ